MRLPTGTPHPARLRPVCPAVQEIGQSSRRSQYRRRARNGSRLSFERTWTRLEVLSRLGHVNHALCLAPEAVDVELPFGRVDGLDDITTMLFADLHLDAFFDAERLRQP